MPDQLGLTQAAPLDLIQLLINLVVGIVLSLILRWHFERFGSTLSNRGQFAQVFPFIVLTTTLIITIVKSSLALSLGLVGALSIVRFRTPIKEPEELAYLFMGISMGLGLGADQTTPTIVASALILTVIAFLRWRRSGNDNRNLYLSLDWKSKKSDAQAQHLKDINAVLSKHTDDSDLRRYDCRDNGEEAIYYVDVPSSDSLTKLMTDLKKELPGVNVTFIDQNQVPSV